MDSGHGEVMSDETGGERTRAAHHGIHRVRSRPLDSAMRQAVMVLCLVALGCAPATTGSSSAEYWDAFPWSEVQFEGPAPLISAFLTPATENPRFHRAVLVFTNTAPDSLRVLYGDCDFGLRLYPNASFIGSPVWDSRIDACDLLLRWIDVPPGETRTRVVFAYVDPVDAAKRVSPGHYYAAVTWRSSRKSLVRTVPAGEVSIP